MKAINLKVQNFYEQIGIDCNPIFMWELKEDLFQLAYKIIISDNKLENNILFDTGKVISGEQNNIEVNINLKSHTKYYYKVGVWNENNILNWSDTAEFITGIFREEDWKAEWISRGTTKPFYALKEIKIEEDISEAYISISGLGQFKLAINGEKVGNHELDPGWTDYNKQIQYVTFDVKDYLKMGTNQFSVEIANGWYLGDTSEGRHFYTLDKGYKTFGSQLCLLAQIHIKFSDGREEIIITNDSWKTTQSETTLSNVYGSEDYDASLSELGQPILAEILQDDKKPKGKLTSQTHPPVIVKKVYDTVKITEPEKGKYIFDLGQNMSGFFEVHVKGEKGSKIKIIPVEKLTPQGKIDKTVETWSTYTLRGTGGIEVWKPSFSYAAGRYVQIEGATRRIEDKSKPYIADVKGHFITSASEDVGTFKCSDKRYEDIFGIILKSIESNLNHVHSDCPTIEKLGWMEPSHLMAASVMYNKNVDQLWGKIARDIREAQYGEEEYDTDSSKAAHEYGPGLIPSIAPRYAKFLKDWGDGSFWDITPWGSSILLAAFEQYRFYGNKKVLKENYNSAKKYLAYLKDKYDNYNSIYNKQGEERFLCHGLGDWGMYGGFGESRENTETAFFYVDLITMAKFSEVLGYKLDIEFYEKIAKEVLENYNKALLVKDPATGQWCYKAYDIKDKLTIMQANQAIPLHYNMVPEDKLESVKKAFFDSVKEHQFISGEIGLRYIFLTLAKYDHNDIVHDMIMQPKHPSYIRFVEQGETTLPEFWSDTARSRNHDMMGHIMEWFYSEIGGISSEDGYKNIRIAPHLTSGLTWVNCSYKGITGDVKVNTKLLKDKLLIEVTIPVNTTAKIYLPKIFDPMKIFCNGEEVHNSRYYEVYGGFIYNFEISVR